MNILLMTNTYKPLIGGLEKSVINFSEEFRAAGHRVLIVCPEYPNMVAEKDVIRVNAIQRFNGSDFSVQLPIQGTLTEALGDFQPDIVHSQHPFLIGDTALRIASKYNVPLVFTHHTLYEQNVHYVPGNEEALKRFVIELSTGYANLADHVFAPSESVMQLIKDRGVTSTIDVVPTGIFTEEFAAGDGKALRKKLKIPAKAFVVGHVGRLAPEKNLEFVTRAVALFLKAEPKAHFLIGGTGPSVDSIKEIMTKEGVVDRLHLAGMLKGKALVNAYHAMNVFVFASQSETQGLVVTEAMAAGIPVVAVDASGIREVVKDRINGRLLVQEDMKDFIAAMAWIKNQPAAGMKKMKKACQKTAQTFSMKECAEKALKIYLSLAVNKGFFRRKNDESIWSNAVRSIQTQWGLAKNLTHATRAFMSPVSADAQKIETDSSLPDLSDASHKN
jgi:1,2-diacylglycerol 3-alpha-glucosyltransferase